MADGGKAVPMRRRRQSVHGGKVYSKQVDDCRLKQGSIVDFWNKGSGGLCIHYLRDPNSSAIQHLSFCFTIQCVHVVASGTDVYIFSIPQMNSCVEFSTAQKTQYACIFLRDVYDILR